MDQKLIKHLEAMKLENFDGKEFIGLKRDYDLEPEEIFERLIDAGPDGLLPELKNNLKK